ncbi:MAG: hypothetical protein Q9173_006220 [Seirophora scorigena]
MILQSHRALARLSYFRPQCLDKRVSLALNVARVSTQLRSRIGAYDDALCTSTSAFSSSLPCRPYATDAVSRPKAHTGRTTSAPRKKAATAKATTSATAPTTEESTTKKPAPKKPAAKKSAAKKPAAKKPKTTPKKKSKPRTRAKSTEARKKPTKAKKRPLTSEQKEKQTKREHLQAIKDLKKKALEVPTKLPTSAFSVLLSEQMKERHVEVKQGAGVVAKDCSARYRSFSPEQRESKALQPYRQSEQGGECAEWRALSADDKKVYTQAAEEDSARYDQEVKAVFNRDVVHATAKAA